MCSTFTTTPCVVHAYKWLDLESLWRRLLPQDEINQIRYFTARITARPEDGPRRSSGAIRKADGVVTEVGFWQIVCGKHSLI